MSQPDFNLAESKIAIIGLGLMGGSLALGLKGKCAALYGCDPHLPTLELALSQHIVDYADSDPARLLPEVDLVILSAPVPAILTLLEKLPTYTSNPCIVMDLGSTKRLIVDSMSRLPERFDPIGGHPICGKEKLSLANAERTLYYAAPFLLTPLAIPLSFHPSPKQVLPRAPTVSSSRCIRIPHTPSQMASNHSHQSPLRRW